MSAEDADSQEPRYGSRGSYLTPFLVPSGARLNLMDLTGQLSNLPVALRRTLTWDQGKEMAEHARFTLDTGVLFPETYETRQRLIERYPIRFERIEPELTAKIFKRGYRVYEIPITYDGRGYEEGKAPQDVGFTFAGVIVPSQTLMATV